MSVVLSTAALALAAPAHAVPPPPTPRQARAYEHAYELVARRFGARAPGRNIIRFGLPSHRRPSAARVRASLATLDRMLAPPSVIASAATVTGTPAPEAPAAPVAAPPVTGAGALPACASESGTNYSTGPQNTNPSSGATGRYQILPSTAAGYGCSLATPAGQDACAQVIYAHQGAGAWVGCGG